MRRDILCSDEKPTGKCSQQQQLKHNQRMKTLTIAAMLLLTTLASLGEELQLYMSASPAQPIVGEVVTWKVKAFGGSTKTYTWNSDPQEMPWLYNWSGNYPYARSTQMTNIYSTTGSKSVTVAVGSGNRSIARSLSMEVKQGRITDVTPNGNEVWEVGKTYPITWKSEGAIGKVQIAIYDHRYNSEVEGAGGMILVAFSVPNTGSYEYTVPEPSEDGLSKGDLGGKNYRISVGPWNNAYGSWSAKPFTIRTAKH
jgi:hypothetical protein